jgi:hypothetical protein
VSGHYSDIRVATGYTDNDIVQTQPGEDSMVIRGGVTSLTSHPHNG